MGSCINRQQYIVWDNIINFYFMPKIIRILKIMFHEKILYISYCKYIKK